MEDNYEKLKRTVKINGKWYYSYSFDEIFEKLLDLDKIDIDEKDKTSSEQSSIK